MEKGDVVGHNDNVSEDGVDGDSDKYTSDGDGAVAGDDGEEGKMMIRMMVRTDINNQGASIYYVNNVIRCGLQFLLSIWLYTLHFLNCRMS